MCGIAGIWGEENETVVRGMLRKLAHRGPDAEGLHLRPHVGVLGHRRLAIMDPEGGDQPILSDSGGAIAANGEIYNFQQLRADLEDRRRFHTTSDSEVILHLFEEQGAKAVKELDGIFAFAMDDGRNLILARDPLGIKPLYYGSNRNQRTQSFYFASEIKALAGLCDEVKEFPPGATYHTERGFQQYYAVSKLVPRNLPAEDWVRSIRQALEAAIVAQLMSDVPLGAFLSGGLDSSLIAAIARRHLPELHTFSVGIEGSPDLEAARVVARHIDSIHHEYSYTGEEVLEQLPQILYYLESFDQDLVRSAIPCYFCARLAADYVKVILTGEGADELFAGYSYYREIADYDHLHRELRRSVTALHNVNLQRVDRMTMAHGVEGRVPFLDLALVELAQTIPVEWKLHDDGTGRRVEKWILRKACEDLLPPEILWRRKEQFDEGSGTVSLLEGTLGAITETFDAAAYMQEHRDSRLRSAEESFYHRTLCQVFDTPQPILDNVGRWADRVPSSDETSTIFASVTARQPGSPYGYRSNWCSK